MLNDWRGPTISVRALTSYEISDELCRRQLQVKVFSTIEESIKYSNLHDFMLFACIFPC